MGVLIIITQFILSLSILVILHELGHFLPAKLFKTRVEKFYLFFDPYFSLIKKKIGETEYGVGWLPLGGYVKISGMIDESMDKEQMKQPPQPWEFRSKPSWQRLIIMLGGVTVNFILGFFLFAMILTIWGEEYLPNSQVVNGINVDSLGADMGLHTGDKILKIGDSAFNKFNPPSLKSAIIFDDVREVTVERMGEPVTIPIDDKYVSILTSYDYKEYGLFNARIPCGIAKVSKGTPGQRAGLQAEDQIVGINGIPIRFYDEFTDVMKGKSNEQIELEILRDEMLQTLSLTTDEDGKIGFNALGPAHYFDTERQEYTFVEAIPAGVTKGIDFLAKQINAFGKMFSGKIKAKDSLGGFGTLAGLFPDSWNWESFWNITAILSLILGFMNLLPIPALDGGHVMFLIYEVVSGRKPSDKFMEYATIVGFVLIIALLLYANGLDVLRWWKS